MIAEVSRILAEVEALMPAAGVTVEDLMKLGFDYEVIP